MAYLGRDPNTGEHIYKSQEEIKRTNPQQYAQIYGESNATSAPTSYSAPPITGYDDYNQNEQAGNKRMDEAWQGIKDLPTAMTPEEKLKEQNRVVARHQEQNAGQTEAIKAQMAAQGLGGSGAEISNIGKAMARGASGLSGELTDLGNKQSEADMARQYQKSGLMTGGASEFGQVGQGWDKNRLEAANMQNQLAQQRAQDEWSAQMYEQQKKQWDDMLNKIMPGLLGGNTKPGLGISRIGGSTGYGR